MVDGINNTNNVPLPLSIDTIDHKYVTGQLMFLKVMYIHYTVNIASYV